MTPYIIRPATPDDASDINAHLRRIAEEPNNTISYSPGEKGIVLLLRGIFRKGKRAVLPPGFSDAMGSRRSPVMVDRSGGRRCGHTPSHRIESHRGYHHGPGPNQNNI